MEPTILNFNPKKYKFREWACESLGVTCLEHIHEIERIKTLNRSPTTNQLSQYFPEIEDSYRSFVLELLGDMVSGISSYQSPPSFRFHYCGRSSSVFHRDRDFGVEDGRINVWVPLTSVWGENSLWLESDIGAKNYKPIVLKLGQALIFDGVNLGHGSMINTTDSTRVSFDFRFLPGLGPAMATSY
jgi:hypothetical protein